MTGVIKVSSVGIMLDFNGQESSKLGHGREIDPPIYGGRGKKKKSCDVITDMEVRLAKVELTIRDSRDMVDLLGHSPLR